LNDNYYKTLEIAVNCLNENLRVVKFSSLFCHSEAKEESAFCLHHRRCQQQQIPHDCAARNDKGLLSHRQDYPKAGAAADHLVVSFAAFSNG